jgi:hypothetical protein
MAVANSRFYKRLLLSRSTGKRPADQAAQAFFLPLRHPDARLVSRFFAKPVNLDNTVKSRRIVSSRWLGWRTRAETTPRFVLKRRAQRLSKDSFPDPPIIQAKSEFRGGLW